MTFYVIVCNIVAQFDGKKKQEKVGVSSKSLKNERFQEG